MHLQQRQQRRKHGINKMRISEQEQHLVEVLVWGLERDGAARPPVFSLATMRDRLVAAEARVVASEQERAEASGVHASLEASLQIMRGRLAMSEMQVVALDNGRDWLTPRHIVKTETKARAKEVVSTDAVLAAGLAFLICLLAIPVAEWQEKARVLYTLWASLRG